MPAQFCRRPVILLRLCANLARRAKSRAQFLWLLGLVHPKLLWTNLHKVFFPCFAPEKVAHSKFGADFLCFKILFAVPQVLVPSDPNRIFWLDLRILAFGR